MNISDDDFISLVKRSTSIRQILQNIGMTISGGNYKSIKRMIYKLDIDCSHFLGQGYLKGKHHNWRKGMDLKEILVENSPYKGSTTSIKEKILKAGILENKCYRCGITEWMGQKLAIELEHKNGVNTDNRIENLTLLCPNCHSQTSTYCGKNKYHYSNRARIYHNKKRYNLGCYKTVEEARNKVNSIRKLKYTMSNDEFKKFLIKTSERSNNKQRIIIKENGKFYSNYIKED